MEIESLLCTVRHKIIQIHCGLETEFLVNAFYYVQFARNTKEIYFLLAQKHAELRQGMLLPDNTMFLHVTAIGVIRKKIPGGGGWSLIPLESIRILFNIFKRSIQLFQTWSFVEFFKSNLNFSLHV